VPGVPVVHEAIGDLRHLCLPGGITESYQGQHGKKIGTPTVGSDDPMMLGRAMSEPPDYSLAPSMAESGRGFTRSPVATTLAAQGQCS
jgi:hypothetical protein